MVCGSESECIPLGRGEHAAVGSTGWITERLMIFRMYKLYTYTSSYIIANSFAEHILSGEKNAVKKYLEFLSAGESDYPVNVVVQIVSTRIGIVLSASPLNDFLMGLDQLPQFEL